MIIGIGSAQLSHTFENPFTAGERHLMISQALQDIGLHNYFLVPIMDINRYAIWVAHVSSLVPPFQEVYTNNSLTKRLSRSQGTRLEKTPLFDRDIYSGTEIRRRIVHGEAWEKLVPTAVSEIIHEIDGDQHSQGPDEKRPV